MRHLPPLLLAMAALANAGEDGLAYLDPRPPPDDLRLRGGGEMRADRAGASDDGGSLAMDRESLRLAWLAARSDDQEFWPEGRATRTALHGDLRLDGMDPAGAYLDAAAGATWRRRHDDGRILGLSAAATWTGRGDVSGGLRSGATVNVFARLPLPRPGDGLLLFLSYDSRSNPLFGIPVIPAAAWQATRGPWSLILGLPFSTIGYRQPAWSVQATIIPLPALSGDLRLAGPLRVVAEGRFGYTALTPVDPPSSGERIFISEWEGAAGLRCAAGPGRGVDLVAGWAAGRRIGVADRFLDARHDGSRLEAEPFLALRGRWSF